MAVGSDFEVGYISNNASVYNLRAVCKARIKLGYLSGLSSWV